MLYTLQSHVALESVIQYIPENSVVSGDDIVPGVDEVGEGKTSWISCSL